MCSMHSMHGGLIFRNLGPLLKVHHCQHLASMTKHDTSGSPPGAACDSLASTTGNKPLCIEHIECIELLSPLQN
jgi:hypothetical protein